MLAAHQGHWKRTPAGSSLREVPLESHSLLPLNSHPSHVLSLPSSKPHSVLGESWEDQSLGILCTIIQLVTCTELVAEQGMGWTVNLWWCLSKGGTFIICIKAS